MRHYYLATGDLSAIREAWPNFKKRIGILDRRFVPEKGLVKAPHSTSNDFFLEPHAGGFALGTEAYIMQAYLAMARMGTLLGAPEDQIQQWQARGQLLRTNIRNLYW